MPRHLALKQCQSGDRTHHELLPGRTPCADLSAARLESSRDHLTTSDPFRGRATSAGTRSHDGYTAHQGSDQKGQIDTLKEAMEQGIDEGCQTFDHVLFQLYQAGKISIEQALINADSANNLRLKIKLEGLKGDDAVNALLDKEKKDERGFQIQGGQAGQSTLRNR